MLTLKLYEPKDYPEICRWWNAHNWPNIPEDALAEIGIVAWNDATPICAAWLYLMTRYWGLIEWVVTNPDAPLKDRPIAVELIIERLIEEAKGFQVKTIFSSLRSNGLIRLYQKHGFTVSDTGMTNVTLNIG